MGATVAIIGDGAMGTVCSILLAANGHTVRLWGRSPDYVDVLRQTRQNPRYLPEVRIPDDVLITPDASQAFAGADLIVSAVPCQYVRGVWASLKPTVPPHVPLCSVAKGIETDTLLRPTQIIHDVLGERPLAVLTGPNIARELARRLPAGAVAASTSPDLARFCQQCFTTSWFRVYTIGDVIGAELAGATKNVIALAAGMADGLAAGANAKAALITRGIAEITRLGIALGAQRETFFGLAGIGDLITTCISRYGRNRAAGELFGRGKRLDDVLASTPSVIEGIPTTRSVIELARRTGVEMPITAAVADVIFNGKDPIAAITDLMNRPLKPE